MASITCMVRSKHMICYGNFESQIRTVQSADADMNVRGWKLFQRTLYTANRCPYEGE